MFFSEAGNTQIMEKGALVKGSISLSANSNPMQPSLWQDSVRLDDEFWRSLQAHPVPVRDEAIQAISNRSIAIDVYIWLSYRRHVLTKPAPITWAALYAQFGAGFPSAWRMKSTFLEALKP